MPSTLNVIFHNQIGGVVRVVIRNARGEIFYEEYAAHVRYQRRFNLASFPKGSYSVDLSEQHASGAQAFTFSIGSPGTNQIAMESPPVKLDSGKRAGMALAGNP